MTDAQTIESLFDADAQRTGKTGVLKRSDIMVDTQYGSILWLK